MSRALAPGIQYGWSEEYGRNGCSEDSTQLSDVLKQAHKHRTEPVSLGWKRRLHDQAMEIGAECAEPGWDCYGGIPISRESVIKTMYLIEHLPEPVQPPFLVPSPGGYISFECHDDEKRVLSVSPKNDLLVWASVLGINETRYGRSPARNGWPEPVLEILKDYFTHV